jgi:outer membrane protein TolC
MVLRIFICSVTLIALSHGPAVAGEVSIRFEDINEYAIKNSPHAFLLDKDLEYANAERDVSLRWSNPELIGEMERIDDGSLTLTEYTIAVEKELTLPWVGARNRTGRNLELEAARYRKRAHSWRLRSSLRQGYITLNIYRKEAELLGTFELLMENASDVADARKTEGAISGVEQRMIEMSLLGIRKKIQSNRDEYRIQMAEWKTDMGIPHGRDVILESDNLFFQEGLQAHLTSVAIGDTTADISSRELYTQALAVDIKRESGGILPSMTVAGGYKNVEDTFEGFVVGLSMPIPLLNRNSGGTDRARVEYERAKIQLDLYRSTRARHIEALVAGASEKVELIERYRESMEEIDKQVEDLAVSYREGWMTLAELLGGVDVYIDGIEHYFDLIDEYYAAVFELEAVLERELLHPALQEMEDKDK